MKVIIMVCTKKEFVQVKWAILGPKIGSKDFLKILQSERG